MDAYKHLFTLAEAYSYACGIKVTTAAKHASGDARLFTRLAAGDCSITLRRARRVAQWFSDHWPAGLAWPEGIDRPAPAADSPAAEAGLAAAGPGAAELQGMLNAGLLDPHAAEAADSSSCGAARPSPRGPAREAASPQPGAPHPSSCGGGSSGRPPAPRLSRGAARANARTASQPGAPLQSSAPAVPREIHREVNRLMGEAAQLDYNLLVAGAAAGGERAAAKAAALRREALAAASALGADGKIASPRSLCRAVDAGGDTYQQTVAQYRDGGRKSGTWEMPRAGSKARAVLDALLAAGDARFSKRIAAQAEVDARLGAAGAA